MKVLTLALGLRTTTTWASFLVFMMAPHHMMLVASGAAVEEGTCSIVQWQQQQQSGDDTCDITDDHADTTAASSSSSTMQQARIIDWIRSAGGEFNSKQEFRRIIIPSDMNSSYTSCIHSGASYDAGIFATQDIAKGELLVRVPWQCVITGWDDRLDDHDEFFFCGSIRKLVDEMRLGDESFFAPYTSYLRQQPRGKLPSDWSEAGKQLLLQVIHDENEGLQMEPYDLPPDHVVDMLDIWREHCGVVGDDVALQELAALEHFLRSDDENLVPLYDLYNHANGKKRNAMVEVKTGEMQTIYASRDIEAGEQIHISYNLGSQLSEYSNKYYSTPEFLRDYGFVESMPQRWVWVFDEVELGFELSNATGEVKLRWMDRVVDWFRLSREPEYLSFIRSFLRRQLRRLVDHVEPLLLQVEKKVGEKSCRVSDKEDDGVVEALRLPTPQELATIHQYSSALQTAIELALDELEWPQECSKGQIRHGLCDKSYRDLKVVHGNREPNHHENFPTYNDDIYPEPGEDGWEEVEYDMSGYQEIGWLKRPAVDDEENNDVCFLLDGMAQTCSCFSPHYHDPTAHFGTRYLEDVKRVAIVGGGDAKMLYEFMKYNETLELLVHLELDQKVVRKSFKHFAMQPHFDDERVEWWFGDATKSLLMLPSEYFGTFDLVIVDLSESGPLSFDVSLDLTVFDSIARLVAPQGILVKNELYIESLNEMFDSTMLLYFEGVPLIHSWGLSFASNRKDFLTRDPATMQKWHNIETVRDDFSTNPLGLDDHFKFAHDYQKNDARAQGKCDLSNVAKPSYNAERGQPLAGILLILEAENATPPSGNLVEWSASMESVLSTVVKEVGLTPLSTITNSLEDDKVLGALILAEGVVVARTWPKENYIAFDVQLWGVFDKLKGLRMGLAKSVGSESLSSYRIITTGIRGIATEGEDRKKTGPPNVNHRDCSVPELKANVISHDTIDTVVEGSLEMIQGKGGAVVVLCGSEADRCGSHNVISKHKDFPVSVTVWACPSVASLDYSSGNFKHTDAMLACEVEVVKQLNKTVAQHGKLAAFVVDESAPIKMVKVADRIWRNGRYRKKFLAKQFTFIATIEDESETWRREFLDLRRSEMIDYGHLFRAEVVLKSSTGSLEVGVLSGQDLNFFSRLINVTTAIGERTGIEAEIRKVEGGVEEAYSFQKSIWYNEGHVDRRAGEAQFLEQRPLGEQHVLQLGVIEGRLSEDHIKMALQAAQINHENIKMDTAHVGIGLVITSVSSQGTVVLVWDGEERLDLNMFSYSPLHSFSHDFSKIITTDTLKLEQIAMDEMPRGTGRVVNVMKDLVKHDN